MSDTIVETSRGFSPHKQPPNPEEFGGGQKQVGTLGILLASLAEGFNFASRANTPRLSETLFETLIQATRGRGQDYYRKLAGFHDLAWSMIDAPTESPGFLKRVFGPTPLYLDFVKDVGSRLGNNRRLGITSRELLALIPSKAKVGDGIFILRGSGIPFVLRESGTAGDERKPLHRLMGDAYVRGIMYGEAINGGDVRQEIVLE